MHPTIKRRQFVGSLAAGAAVLTTPSFVHALDKDNPYRKNIGLQLYTLRKEIDEDVKATIKAVADAGYQQVEPYGFPNCLPMIQAAGEHGLKLHSSHFNADPVIDGSFKKNGAFDKILEKANQVGLKHLVIPYLSQEYRGSIEIYQRLCENFNLAAEKATAAGIQLAYHNHAFEFEPLAGGQSGYDVMVQDFSNDLKFELDVFWVVVSGNDPIALMKKLRGRVTQLHLKDLSKSFQPPMYDGIPEDAFEEIGDGMIDMESVILAAGENSVEHCHIEQDHSPHPLASIQQSMRQLQSM